ncbi:uncharacterized protein [Pleurodeles waltl]|uniref:uncharacterized protein isoform X2 n=1 Tax=Pleurodeles waltl TaxID=8319 RepID=UPI00370997F5
MLRNCHCVSSWTHKTSSCVCGPAPYTICEVARFEDPDVSTANMNAQEIREFQRRAVRYQHILDVEAGFHMMARRYRHERATGA